MTVLITLITAGANSGPFDLYSDVDGYASPFETGVSKAALLLGYSSSLVPDIATVVRVFSTGACTNYIDISILSPRPTTSTTSTAATTTTTTTLAVYEYELVDCNGAPTIIYTTCNSLAPGCFLYIDNLLTSTAPDGYYCSDPGIYSNCYVVSGGLGEVTSVAGCS